MVFPGASEGLRYTEWVDGQTDGSVAQDATLTENVLTFAGAKTLKRKWGDSEREAVMHAARISPQHKSAFLAQMGESESRNASRVTCPERRCEMYFSAMTARCSSCR